MADNEGVRGDQPISDDDEVQRELKREAGEGKGDIGDLGTNRNLSGSSTWDTLPDPPSNADGDAQERG